MPIFIICNWEVAIRPIEIEKFSNIFGKSIKSYASSAEGRGLMQVLTKTGFNLLEIITFEDSHYNQIRLQVSSAYNAKVNHLFDLFDNCREIIKQNYSGSNVLRYLIYHMNNEVIDKQLDGKNDRLMLYNKNCHPILDVVQ